MSSPLNTTAFAVVDPFADPVARRRIGALQTLYIGLCVGLAGLAFGVGLVVGYALDWQPLAGHRITFHGVSLPTVLAAVVTILTPPAAIWLGRRTSANERRAIARSHPELAGTTELADRRLTGFAAVVFAEAIVPVVVGFALSVQVHVTADWLMFLLVGLLLIWLGFRYPTTERARAWLAAT